MCGNENKLNAAVLKRDLPPEQSWKEKQEEGARGQKEGGLALNSYRASVGRTPGFRRRLLWVTTSSSR